MKSSNKPSTSTLLLIGLAVSILSTVLLLLVDKLWDHHAADYVGFGLLIGFSLAAICKK